MMPMSFEIISIKKFRLQKTQSNCHTTKPISQMNTTGATKSLNQSILANPSQMNNYKCLPKKKNNYKFQKLNEIISTKTSMTYLTHKII